MSADLCERPATWRYGSEWKRGMATSCWLVSRSARHPPWLVRAQLTALVDPRDYGGELGDRHPPVDEGSAQAALHLGERQGVHGRAVGLDVEVRPLALRSSPRPPGPAFGRGPLAPVGSPLALQRLLDPTAPL